MRSIKKNGPSKFIYAYEILGIQLDPNFWNVATPSENKKAIALDLNRQRFISENPDVTPFKQRWEKAAKQENGYTYIQGDMCAASTPALFRDKILIPQLSKGSSQEEVRSHLKEISFGYINDKLEMCGFSIIYNEKNLSQWVACIVLNTTAIFKNRKVTTYINNIEKKPDKEPKVYNDVLESLESKQIAALLTPLINSKDNTVNEKFFSILQVPSDGGIVVPGHSTQPSVIMNTYQKRLNPGNRIMTVKITQESSHNTSETIKVNLDEELNHENIEENFSARLKILCDWLKEDLLFSIALSSEEDSLCYTKEESPLIIPKSLTHALQSSSKETILIVPLNLVTHWDLLAIRIQDSKIIRAEYLYSCTNQPSKILCNDNPIVQVLKAADPSFNGKVTCCTHFYSTDLKASGNIIIENAIHIIRSLASSSEQHTPTECPDETIAIFRAHHIRAVRLNTPNQESEITPPRSFQ